MRPDRPVALILDDGELVEVRALLEEMGVAYAEEPGEGGGSAKDFALLVSTPARALALRATGGDAFGEDCRLHVVVAAQGVQQLPPTLASVGCDLVLRQPLDPTVLRLLVQRVSYQGTERRRVRRVALGVPVGVRAGDRQLEAVLAQLSGRGCGLLLGEALETDQRVSVEPRTDLTDGTPVRFEGRVCSVDERGQGDGDESYDVSVVFDPLEAPERKAVRSLMGRSPAALELPARCSGTGEVVPVTGHVTRRDAPSHSPEDETGDGERRRDARRRYRRRILGGVDGSACPLIGRDLSANGMRVERTPVLGLGDAVKLAIYGDASSRPLVIQAVVVRDDGLAGWFLRFQDLTPASVEALARLMDSLPALQPVSNGSRPTGLVVSEIVEPS